LFAPVTGQLVVSRQLRGCPALASTAAHTHNRQDADRSCSGHNAASRSDPALLVRGSSTSSIGFDPRDRDLGPRDLPLVMLAGQPKVHLGQLAAVFGASDEYLI
jgi:hypothetical protein